MREDQRSGCPINLSLEVFGDRWSLIVIRDIMFGNRRHFRKLLSHFEEGIASNILSARLKHLIDLGMITKADDPSHKQKAIYSLTEKAIELVPVFAMLGAWGRRHLTVSRELSIRAELLEKGGPEMWEAFMEELRTQHLGTPKKPGARSVFAELRAMSRCLRRSRPRRSEPPGFASGPAP
jgi:DNA-binding HxlR family transcriptional regulator